MITKVEIKNYRSIVDATVELSPFTLLIGANGTGKSNFLRLFEDISKSNPGGSQVAHPKTNALAMRRIHHFVKHFNHQKEPQKINIMHDQGDWATVEHLNDNGQWPKQLIGTMEIFTLNPENIGKPEELIPTPVVKDDGAGAVQVLDSLKTGDREDLFEQIEKDLKRFIPEIEKLSFVPAQASKQLQVREKHIEQPVPVATLSEGTRLILTILTIIHQEDPPKFIGLEEIDRGLHPRLFQQLIELLHYVSEEKGIQVVATTHNPYLIDEFKDREEAVIIVEKENGATTFTSLEDKLENLLSDEMPLGTLWYSGIVGGVPEYAR